MKRSLPICSVAAVAVNLLLAACGSDTVVHERPVVVQTAPTARMTSPDADSVEATCKHGYDNSKHACY